MILTNKKGFGVEDAPFMILATVAVLMLIVWIGVEAMSSFVEGNEYQAGVEASTEIYKRAKLVTLGYDGSTERVKVTVPDGYGVLVNNSIVTVSYINITDPLNSSNSTLNMTGLTAPMLIQGVKIVGANSTFMGPGDYTVQLTYSTKDDAVIVSWE